MPETDRRRKIESLLCPDGRLRPTFSGCRNAQAPVQEIVDQLVATGWIPPERIVPAPGDRDEFASGELGNKLRAGVRLDQIVVAMDEEHGALNLAVHGLAHIEGRG